MAEETGNRGGEETGHPQPALVKVGVIVTIVASIAGLLTTGVATLYGARVADNQLDQSEQVAEEKKRAQATRVSYWVDIQEGAKPRLHLMNRSLDPISNVQMGFIVLLSFEGDQRPISFAVKMPSVPPCSDMVFTLENMRYDEYHSRDHSPILGPPLDKLPTDPGWLSFGKTEGEPQTYPPINESEVDFNDRDGVRWRRARGLLTRSPEELRLAGDRWGVVKVVPPTPLKSCDEKS
ncbi:hypothetical protein AB0O22_31700 [Streptomyces sp. NPDC091204]|uniref:hypothetical protein n=1 Tax=Streptomyces sp. NPDC091204 TaxID=3155299 RepID=UPI003446B688